MNDLPKRVLTAILALPILLGLVLYTTWGTSAILALAAAGGTWEMTTLLTPPNHRPKTAARLIASTAAVAIIAATSLFPSLVWTFAALLAIPTALFFFARPRTAPTPWFSATTALAVVTVPLSSLHIPLHNTPTHAAALFGLVFLVTWFGDAGAYFVGKTLGRHKLAPTVSPNKTWEGALGGLLTAIILGSAYCTLTLPHISLLNIALLCAITNIAGQSADLFESSLKRARGVKDSGTMIPGYGGMLDKIDSLLFAAPVFACAWYILVL